MNGEFIGLFKRNGSPGVRTMLVYCQVLPLNKLFVPSLKTEVPGGGSGITNAMESSPKFNGLEFVLTPGGKVR